MRTFIFVAKLILIYSLFSAASICCWSSMHLGFGRNETDRQALLAIKAQIKEDPNQVMSSWNESVHFCMWHCVACSRRHHQRVTKLDLQSQNLVGSLSPHVGNLSFLRELQLQNNSFSRDIPSEIAHLRRLLVLGLNNNSFTGAIPPNISYCLDLTIMNLAENLLVGKIPYEIGSLSKLQQLLLRTNTLTGDLPPFLGNLSSLEILGAAYNNLVGSIPSSLGQLRKLTFLEFGANNLSGTIPHSIYNLSALVLLSISVNQIQGVILSDFAKTLPNLQFFGFALNQFTGSIPLSISNATSISYFDVSSTKLTGHVPNLRKLHNLAEFYVDLNYLGSGKDGDLSFLSDLTNATQLVKLSLGDNNFGGTLPTSISNLSSKLDQLYLYSNQLYGSIPSGIVNLVNMESLVMDQNSFTGNIPIEIGKLSRISMLFFSENKLSGSIPSSFGNLTKMIQLGLDTNNLQGSIPSSLVGCQSLQILDLSYNNLNGTIPQQIFGLPSLSIYMSLASNHFTGFLPAEVGELKNLGQLEVSDNMLSGELPSSLGNCESLEFLHLQGNFFNGSIPSSLISLRGIRELDLSRNNLSGEIPQFLAGFALQILNLSFNEFWGAVPIGGVFKNASAISIVGNTRLCGGVANLKLAKCKIRESKKGESSHSLKLIIPLVFGLALLGIAMMLAYFSLCSSRKKMKEISLSTLANSFLQVSYAALLEATDGFSSANLIGVGSFGSVYKGVLDDNDGAQLVAVKVFNLLRHGASKSFIAECEALRNIRHRNLVKIITACSSVDFLGNDFKALVYEFMGNGSLEEWLHPLSGIEEVRDHAPRYLNLLQRLDIAIHVACALDYLHNRCETPIVHCDLKPSNVLLDNELTGHVSDFGLARFIPQQANDASENQTSSMGIRGTVGYAAPEYGMGSDVSIYGDVYSFGILLLEMFTGKRPTDDKFSGSWNLHSFVTMAFPERVTEVADSLLLQVDMIGPSTSNQCREKAHKVEACLTLILKIGIACSAESPRDRKEISNVVSELHSIKGNLLR